MKHILFFLATTTALLMACSDYEDLTEDSSYIATRAIVDENNPSITNPDLIDNWENLDVIYLNTKDDGEYKKATTPWTNGASTNLSELFNYDIKKEDGWKMLFHTFKEASQDEGQNYMCFYNQFTGFIKVFFYYDGHEHSQGAQWYVKTSGGKNIKLLDEPTYLTKADSEPANNDMLIISNLNDVPTTGISPGWNGFEFQVSRYSTDLTSMILKIGAYEKHITDYNVLGKATLNTVGTITTDKQESSKISQALANVAGPEAKKLVDKLGDNIFGDMVILGTKISDLIKKIPETGYKTAFMNGLDLIFGKTTSTTTYEAYLTTTGTVEMEGTGTSEETAGIHSVDVNLYSVLNPTQTNSNSNLVTASVVPTTSGHHLGVWTLKENPKVYYDRMALLSNVQKTQSSVSGEIYLPQIIHYDLEPIINPSLLPYIKSYNFSVDFIICDKLEGEIRLSQDINTIYMNNPILYSDENMILKEVPEKKRYTISGLIDVDSYNNGVAFWYDWGKVIDGRLVAVVSLNMTCQYEGKKNNIYQSRVYDVDYGIDTTLTQPELVHHPPYSVVINYGRPYTGTQFGWY